MRGTAIFRRRGALIAIIVVVLGIVFVALPIVVSILFSARFTRYVESDAFRLELEKETAKGLHFPGGRYQPVKRMGMWTAESGGFQASGGWKALTSLNAGGITAKFNPWAVYLRRWQLDDVHIDGGEVGIHTYKPKPESISAKPWFHIFLPNASI